ncbi:ubiquitin-related domain-containing protein [Lasiosphaeria hispida]|uniref:Ubiquitin-related domain-containing protein n=1 Tax=Lasiosphaeria hispida TaxID=260671 RepID=A0AAJ0HP56_9PEZI|nr:ubiquitin-related domain-containing protein [Lasiosphaeria hispida]
MGQSDLEVLLDMGFESARAELAVKKTGGLQGALNWLEENQDKPLEELQAASAGATAGGDQEGATPSISSIQEGENAKSLTCNECGKKFRNHDQASFHASKTDHTDFSESTDEIAPLTEEEKKARLEELRVKLLEKRQVQALQAKEEAKQNEKIRMKSTKEVQDIKEDLARKEQIKEAAKKRQEKQDDLEAKRKIKARIEADKAERKRKEEQAKAAREGRAVQAPAAVAPAPSASRPAATHNEARLRLQTPTGNILKTYPADTTLFEVAQQLETETGKSVVSFTMTFPRKTFESGIDFGKTLKEAGLVPSAAVVVKLGA